MRRPQADRANRRQLREILALARVSAAETYTFVTNSINLAVFSNNKLQILGALQGFCEFAEPLDRGTLYALP